MLFEKRIAIAFIIQTLRKLSGDICVSKFCLVYRIYRDEAVGGGYDSLQDPYGQTRLLRPQVYGFTRM